MATFDPTGKDRIVVTFFGESNVGKTLAIIFSTRDTASGEELAILHGAMTAALIRWLIYGDRLHRVQ